MALFILLSGAAGTGIIGVDLLRRASLRRPRRRVILIGSRYLGRRFSLYLLLNADMAEDPDRILPDRRCHVVKHFIGAHLVFYQRIPLAIGLKADSLAQLLHIVDMGHPFIIDHLKKHHTLNLTDLLPIRELCFFRLIELGSRLF